MERIEYKKGNLYFEQMKMHAAIISSRPLQASFRVMYGLPSLGLVSTDGRRLLVSDLNYDEDSFYYVIESNRKTKVAFKGYYNEKDEDEKLLFEAVTKQEYLQVGELRKNKFNFKHLLSILEDNETINYDLVREVIEEDLRVYRSASCIYKLASHDNTFKLYVMPMVKNEE